MVPFFGNEVVTTNRVHLKVNTHQSELFPGLCKLRCRCPHERNLRNSVRSHSPRPTPTHPSHHFHIIGERPHAPAVCMRPSAPTVAGVNPYAALLQDHDSASVAQERTSIQTERTVILYLPVVCASAVHGRVRVHAGVGSWYTSVSAATSMQQLQCALARMFDLNHTELTLPGDRALLYL
jgi:hypothetical protein